MSTTTEATSKPRRNGKAKVNERQRMRLEWVPLAELRTWPGNPKRHDEELLERSFARFGFIDPFIVDEGTGNLVAGHGRRDKLVEQKQRGLPPPNRIEMREDGEWLVPVLRGIKFGNEQDAEAYLLVNNQAVMRGGYDEVALVEMLERHRDELADIGWSKGDADDLIARVEKMTAEQEISAPEEFTEFDEGQKAGHDCPQCGFRVTCDR